MPDNLIVSRAEAEAASVFKPSSGFHDVLVVPGEQMQLVWARLEPDYPYPMHSHPHDQVSVLIEGRLRLTVGDETRVIEPGDMWHAPAGVEHGGEVLDGKPVVFVDVYSPASDRVKERIVAFRRDS